MLALALTLMFELFVVQVMEEVLTYAFFSRILEVR